MPTARKVTACATAGCMDVPQPQEEITTSYEGGELAAGFADPMVLPYTQFGQVLHAEQLIAVCLLPLPKITRCPQHLHDWENLRKYLPPHPSLSFFSCFSDFRRRMFLFVFATKSTLPPGHAADNSRGV